MVIRELTIKSSFISLTTGKGRGEVSDVRLQVSDFRFLLSVVSGTTLRVVEGLLAELRARSGGSARDVGMRGRKERRATGEGVRSWFVVLGSWLPKACFWCLVLGAWLASISGYQCSLVVWNSEQPGTVGDNCSTMGGSS